MSKGGKKDLGESFQAEFDELQRKFRALDAESKGGNEGSKTKIARTQLQVANLFKDNDRLKIDLEVETRQAKLSTTVTSATQVMRMQAQSDIYARKIVRQHFRFSVVNVLELFTVVSPCCGGTCGGVDQRES